MALTLSSAHFGYVRRAGAVESSVGEFQTGKEGLERGVGGGEEGRDVVCCPADREGAREGKVFRPRLMIASDARAV